MKMIKKLIVLGIISVIIFSFSGCKNKPGFEINYYYEYGVGGLLEVAARSDKTEFDIDDVTIEFSYGWYDYGFHDTPQIKYVFYFLESLNYNYVTAQMNTYDLSNNIDGAIFIKEISAEEFLSSEYEFQMSRRKGKEFNHNEMLTVPKEVIPSDNPDGRGGIMFMLVEVSETVPEPGLSEFEESYNASRRLIVEIPYQFINENTIKIRV